MDWNWIPEGRVKAGFAALVVAALAWSTGVRTSAQTPAQTDSATPTFKAEVVGYIVKDFTTRMESYDELRSALEKGLPPLSVTSDPAEIRRIQVALGNRIRVARARAKQGDIFVPAVSTEFKRVLLHELSADVLAAVMDENPGYFSHRINATYPDGKKLATMPANILQALPRLPEDVEYRFLGPHLVLLDTRANVILDRIRCAIPCTK